MKYIIGRYISQLVETGAYVSIQDIIDDQELIDSKRQSIWDQAKKQNFFIDIIVVFLSDLETPSILELK